MGWTLNTRRVTLCAALLVLLILGVAPIALMFARSLSVNGAFSLESYQHLLATGRSWQLLSNSLGLAMITAVICTLVGLPLGLLLSLIHI